MPFNSTVVIGIAALFIGIGVWAKTKRLGPVLTVVFGAFVLVAVTDASFLTSGGDLVKKILNWVIKQVHV